MLICILHETDGMTEATTAVAAPNRVVIEAAEAVRAGAIEVRRRPVVAVAPRIVDQCPITGARSRQEYAAHGFQYIEISLANVDNCRDVVFP